MHTFTHELGALEHYFNTLMPFQSIFTARIKY